MASIDKLRKEIAATKDDLISNMDEDELESYILKLLTEYYCSYVNNDMARFQSAADNINEVMDMAASTYGNADNFMNFSRAVILSKIMNALVNRPVALDIPDSNVSINAANMDGMNADVLNILTAAIIRRNRDEDEYFKNLEVEMMAEGDYVKHLIRPDINPDFINDHLHILEDILTDEGMTVIKHYINSNGREIANDYYK